MSRTGMFVANGEQVFGKKCLFVGVQSVVRKHVKKQKKNCREQRTSPLILYFFTNSEPVHYIACLILIFREDVKIFLTKTT